MVNENVIESALEKATGNQSRSIAEVHAEAATYGLKPYEGSNEIASKSIKDTAKADYVFGCPVGFALALEASHAIRLNEELGFSAEEALQNLLEEAFTVLHQTDGLEPDKKCHRGAAIGMIHAVCSLAAETITRGDAHHLLGSLLQQEILAAATPNATAVTA